MNSTTNESLDGADEITIAATRAEIIFTITGRMDYSQLHTPEQRRNFDDLVEVAAGLLCEAAPEFIRPVRMNITAVHGECSDSLKKCHTTH